MDNLARDVALAEKLGYGCHYGRFKAVYPNTMDKSIEEILGTGKGSMPKAPPRKEPQMRKCKNCGKEFPAGPYEKIYCNDDCRRYYYDRQKWAQMKGVVEASAKCVICGKPVLTKRRRKYCSDKCYELGYREQYQAYLAKAKLKREQARKALG